MLLKEYRKGAGLTQKEFADKLGKSIHTISKYENGTRVPPTKILELIFSILNVTSRQKMDLIREYGKNS
ncbi:MAG: helix-turn-helix domain-containing protein [Coprobacillaceae bacterium]